MIGCGSNFLSHKKSRIRKADISICHLIQLLFLNEQVALRWAILIIQYTFFHVNRFHTVSYVFLIVTIFSWPVYYESSDVFKSPIHFKLLIYLKRLILQENLINILARHFLICCLSLFLLRILEIKCFKNKLSSYDLVNFMRDFRAVDKGDGTNINISHNQSVNEKIKN